MNEISSMIKRRFEVYVDGNWSFIEYSQIKKGNIIRGFEPNGALISALNGEPSNVALKVTNVEDYNGTVLLSTDKYKLPGSKL